jgi:hypothetical protein
MKRAILILVCTAACFHTHSVSKDDAKDNSAQSAAPAAAAKPSQVRNPQTPGGPPLAAGPGGLFVPGGVEKIQDALGKKGFLDNSKVKRGELDETTSAAVRNFQTDQGIARTGNPDHETLRRLGLDPDQLFRKAENAAN